MGFNKEREDDHDYRTQTRQKKMKAAKPITPLRLTSLLRSEKDPTLALRLFQNPNNSDHSLTSYDVIISKLGRAKMLDQILLQLKHHTNLSPHETIFCHLISYYARAHLPRRALNLFDEMPSFHCARTIKSLNSLLHALSQCGETHALKKALGRMNEFGPPDACTYNILIKASEDVDDTRNVLDEMRASGVEPNDVTLATLVYKRCIFGRVREAMRLKEECERDHKVMANVFVYSTLISALFKAGRKGQVEGLLEEMREAGCEANTVTYNAMIHGHCKEKDFEATYGILDEMAKRGVRPNGITYNVIIDALCKDGRLSEANMLFQDLPRRGCYPDVVTYRMLFSGLYDFGEFKEAAILLDEMIFKGYAPHSARTCKLVEGLCEEGNVELLETVLGNLQKANLLDEDTWRVVISTLGEEKLLDDFELIDNLTIQ